MRALPALSPGVRAVLAVAATSLFMVMVAWATLIGPDAIFTGAGIPERTPVTPTETCVPLETAADGTYIEPDNPRNLPYCDLPPPSRDDYVDFVEDHAPPLWVKVLGWVFLAGVLVAMAAVAIFVLVALWDRLGWNRRERRDEVGFEALSEPDRLASAIAEGSAAQEAVLRDGDPRNAIVEAWLRFEVQGEAAGLARNPWETSSEYAIRVLDAVSADSGAVNRLAALYREARFSEHPITEEHREQALVELTTIRHSLGVRT